MIKDKSLRVLDAALACFVEHGFHATQVAQIAERSRVGEATVYRQLKSKDSILEAVNAYVETLLTHQLQTSEAAPHPSESLYGWVARYWLLAAQVALSKPLAFTHWRQQRSAFQSNIDKNAFSALGPFKTVVNVIQRQINVQHISPSGVVLPLSRPLPLIGTLLVTQWAAALESILSSHIHQTDEALTASILKHSFESCWFGLQLPTYLVAESLPTQKVVHLKIPALIISIPVSTRPLTAVEQLLATFLTNSIRSLLENKIKPILQSHVRLASPILKSSIRKVS